MAKRDVGHIDTATVLMNIEAEINGAKRDMALADRAEGSVHDALNVGSMDPDGTDVDALDYALWAIRYEKQRRERMMRRNINTLVTMALNNKDGAR